MCAPCVPCQQPSQLVPTRCLRLRRPTLLRCRSRIPSIFLPPLLTRQDASAFNQPLSLDTSSVITMNGMFYGASAFNQPLSLIVSSVTDMGSMFSVRSARALPLLCSWTPPCNCCCRRRLRTLISLSHRVPPFDLAEYTIFVQR